MKAKTITYWTSTILVMFVMTVSGLFALLHAPAMMTKLAHLGYPVYFSNILGVAKAIGVVAVLAPGYALVKEWAYTGFGITILSAFYSHWMSGDGIAALEPIVFFALLIVSYATRPANRRLELPSAPRSVRETLMGEAR
ncbi:hypothetical protein CCAX7_50010 [Capsulimonas corticalis]|uniref:Uncharacterized protein n=1 Tax=Capsulimonas corticalis TaxID=2219043 RepID=A0A402CPS3_9BACT|nr:DoxX family protein [Capsulimonas corticalis]BDI32950.1 hypothetical protein CCAX7_50010 [Capsulimonas corticalis]